MTKLITFRANDQEQQLIEDERLRLVEQCSGASVSMASALRSLLHAGTEKAHATA